MYILIFLFTFKLFDKIGIISKDDIFKMYLFIGSNFTSATAVDTADFLLFGDTLFVSVNGDYSLKKYIGVPYMIPVHLLIFIMRKLNSYGV